MRRIAVLLFLLTLAAPVVHAQGRDASRENIRGRALYRHQMRANEKGEIPPNALLNAKREIDAKRLLKGRGARQTMDAGISGWEWLGPGNVGGRIRAICILPNAPQTMLIGGVAGGIWRTFNGGDSWTPVADFMTNLAVTSIVCDPTNPVILYAGTGEGFGNADALQGAGIFKSVDAGLTWTQLQSTASDTFQYTNRLSHHPTQSNILLAGTSKGVFRTTNGGVSWSVFLGNVNALQVSYHPTDPRRMICGTDNDLWLSKNGGANWLKQTTFGLNFPMSPGRCEAAFASTDSIIYVSVERNLGELWRSSNGGRVWTLQNTGTNYFQSAQNQGWYDNCLWIDPTNPNLVVVGGVSLVRSTDAGATLVNAGSLHADHHIILPSPGYNGTTNRVVYVGHDGGLERTDDILTAFANADWVNLNNGLGITQFYGGGVASDGSLVVGGAQDNDKVHYTPAGGADQWYFGPNTDGGYGDGGYAAVDFTDPNRVYGEYVYLDISRSDDGGHTYTHKTSGLGDAGDENRAQFIAPFSMDPNNASTLIGGGKRIWRTVNRGESWVQIRDSIASRSLCTAIDIAPGNSDVIFVGYRDGSLSRSINGGASWDDVRVGGMPSTAVTDIAINPALTSDVMVTFGGYDTNRVWFSSTGGLTWQVRNGAFPDNLPAIQVNTVRFHPTSPDWAYVGTDLGIFASEDKGVTWSVLPLNAAGHEAPANVEVDELFWQGTTHLLAATHGRGMYRSAIQTGIWVDLTNPNPGDGTFANPFQSLQAAINAQADGTPIYVRSGTIQQGGVTFTKRGRVWTPTGPVIVR